MFQALLTRELKSRGVEAMVESAGILASNGAPANEKAIICMKEKGLDITSHRTRLVSDLDLSSYDVVFCVALGATQTLIRLGIPSDKIESIFVADPYGMGTETYRVCAKTLARKAAAIADKLAG